MQNTTILLNTYNTNIYKIDRKTYIKHNGFNNLALAWHVLDHSN